MALHRPKAPQSTKVSVSPTLLEPQPSPSQWGQEAGGNKELAILFYFLPRKKVKRELTLPSGLKKRMVQYNVICLHFIRFAVLKGFSPQPLAWLPSITVLKEEEITNPHRRGS